MNQVDITSVLAEKYTIDESAKRCDQCKKRKGAFIDTFFAEIDGNGDVRCYHCAYLHETDMSNFCEKIEDPISLITAVYADGGLLAMNRLGGVWAWCGVSSSGHRVISGRGTVLETKLKQVVTNNHTEQIAIIRALEVLPEGWSGTVYSDSNVALGRVLWKYGNANLPYIIEERSRRAVARLGKLQGVLLQGHPTEKDLRTGMGARRELPVSIHNHFADLECEAEKEEYFEARAAEREEDAV